MEPIDDLDQFLHPLRLEHSLQNEIPVSLEGFALALGQSVFQATRVY